jgi:hypothetical protein
MRLSAAHVTALALVLVLGGCGAMSQYVLPFPPDRARDTFPFIASAASSMGLMSSQHPDSIHVRLEPGTWVQYMIHPNTYDMVVIVSQGDLPPEQLRQRTLAAKARGDEIWARAMALMRGTPVPSAPAPVPAPEAGSQ